MEKPYAWIGRHLQLGADAAMLYKMYEQFKKETGSGSSLDTYKRAVRRVAFYRPHEPAKSEVRVMKDASGPNQTIVTTSSEIRTLDQLLAYTNVDLGAWEVQRHVVNSWGSGANENFQVKAWLKLRDVNDLDERAAILAMMHEAKLYAPVYPPLSLTEIPTTGYMFELSLFDHHFGQLSWGKETRGKNYDVKKARALALAAVDYQLTKAKPLRPEKILIVLGNDFFNVNSKDNTTAHGTPQAEDDRWQKTFIAGRQLWVEIIERCLALAPVDIMVVPGNHDEERSFYLGDALECWFDRNESVNVYNGPEKRKYYRWGRCLIGFTHGSEERKGKGVLVNLMATEMPQEWAETRYREWHKGHLHAASTWAFQVLDEELGVRESVLPSLVATDDYHAKKGYSHLRETMGMAWHREQGKTDVFMYHP